MPTDTPARHDAPPSSRLARALDWVATGFGAGAVAAFLAYSESHSPGAAVAWGVAGTLGGAAAASAFGALARAFGFKSQAEWARAATPAQRREHRLAAGLGLLLLAGVLATLYVL